MDVYRLKTVPLQKLLPLQRLANPVFLFSWVQ